MDPIDAIAAVVLIVALIGVVIPLLPGTLLTLGTLIVWAIVVGTGEAWTYALIGTAVLAIGLVGKYALAGRHLKTQGVPNTSLMIGGLVGIVGFFVVPVVGLIIGFVGGVYVAELARTDARTAWPATIAALKAVGLSILVELAAALVATSIWFAGALST